MSKVNHYFGIICNKCKYPIALFDDPSQGTTKFAGKGKLSVVCPNQSCRHQDEYDTEQVLHLQVTLEDSL